MIWYTENETGKLAMFLNNPRSFPRWTYKTKMKTVSVVQIHVIDDSIAVRVLNIGI